MQYKDYYQTLGVSKTATEKEIREKFRDQARKYHPDANQGDASAEEKFKDLNEAYQVLSDPEKRKKYDQFGADYSRYSSTGGSPSDFDWSRWASRGGGSGGGGGGGYRSVNVEDLQDIFGGMGGSSVGGMGGFSDFFETLFGGGGMRGAPQQRALRGQDIEQPIEITLDEAFNGTARMFQREDGSRFEVKIPAGVKTGSKVRFTGKGGSSGGGGQAGNLYVKIKVADHPTFDRDRDNLKVDIPVDFFTAALGGEVEVPTMERPVTLKIPAGTQSGKSIRLRGKGMPKLRGKQRGDLIARVNITIPQIKTEEQKKALEDLRGLFK